jgi:hypothetical protein
MRNIDGSYSFWLFGELEKIISQYHLGREINSADSLGILSKIQSVEVRQQKSSTGDGRGSTVLGEFLFLDKENLRSPELQSKFGLFMFGDMCSQIILFGNSTFGGFEV